MPLTDAIPYIPRGESSISPPDYSSSGSSSASNAKRKASQGGDVDPHGTNKVTDEHEQVLKRSKTDIDSNNTTPSEATPAGLLQGSQSLTAQLTTHAQIAASFIPFLSPEALMPPTLPPKEDMEEVLLRLRKEALVQEFFGAEGTTEA